MAEPKTTNSSPLSPSSSLRNGIIALVATALTVSIFFGLRLQNTVPTLGSMAAAAVPLDVALNSGKPSLVEFYADWCTSCQAMVGTMAELEQRYGDRLNFVMLNVDNDKWLPEMSTYNVDGIPHFEFFDRDGQTVAASLGEQPPAVMAANLEALVNQTSLPYVRAVRAQGDGPGGPGGGPDQNPVTGKLSPTDRGLSTTRLGQSDPRSHGAQVKS